MTMDLKNENLIAGKDRIVVLLMKNRTDDNIGGIIIPTEESTKLLKGTVTSVGRSDDNSIHKYDIVLFQKHNAAMYDENTYILKQADVLATVVKLKPDEDDDE
jgi:co-chaperonin GroES (HSP10)